MGSMQAMEMAAHAPREVALRWHLESNHYPPVPLSMLPVCERAIQLAFEEEWHEQLDLPDDVTYRGFGRAPVAAIVESHHLQPFVDALWMEADEQEDR
jgi:hypothetical protein